MELFLSSLAIFSVLSLSAGQEMMKKWNMIAARDFPNDTYIHLSQSMTDTLCSVKCYKNPLCHMFCFDPASFSCSLYRMPLLLEKPYLCHEIFDICHVGGTRCHSRIFGDDVFLGSNIKPFDTEVTTKKGSVKAKNIPNIPMKKKWTWDMPKGKVLKITFNSFDLGPCGCPCTNIKIKKKGSEEVYFDHEYCGSMAVPFTIIIPTNEVEFIFDHDGSYWVDGFDFEYESFDAFYCDPALVAISNTSGVVETADVLNLPQTCVWNVMTPPGTVMTVTFDVFDLGACCGCANLGIVDLALSQRYLRNKQECGSTVPDMMYATISNNIEIQLSTDGSAMVPGFTIRFDSFTAPPTYFGGSLVDISGDSGFIKPTNALLYDHNLNYLWRIAVDEGSRIGLYFVYVFIEKNYDFLDVVESGVSLISGPVSGFIDVAYVETAGNVVEITFTSDHTNRFEGFLLYFMTL